MTFFREVIFPPSKEPKKGKTFQYWFSEVTKWSVIAQKQIETKSLWVTCPICNKDFILKEEITNEEMMRGALKTNFMFYWGIIMTNCPGTDDRHVKKYEDDWYRGYC